MAEVREFLLPDLGEGLTEAEIVRWLVEVGEVVSVDQPVVEVETAKALVEVPCPFGGVVTACFGEAGEEIPVGSPLLTVAVGSPGGESPNGTGSVTESTSAGDSGRPPLMPASGVPTNDATGPSGGSPDSSAAGGESDASGNVLVGYGTSRPSPRRRRVRPTGMGWPRAGALGDAERTPAPLVTAAPMPSMPPTSSSATAPPMRSGAAIRVRPGEVPTAHGLAVTPGTTSHTAGPATQELGPVAVISPLVRRLAREHDLDLRTLSGSGPQGLILRSDVERAAEALRLGVDPNGVSPQTDPSHPLKVGDRASSYAAVDPAGSAQATRIPLRGVRRAVADKLSRSRREIPDSTCWVDADATELLAARAAINATSSEKISMLAVLARITTAALARFPQLNSMVDMASQEIVHLPAINLGFAAQTERGLVVPVVPNAHTLTMAALSDRIGALTTAARAGTLTPADLQGGTFTLNNYGVFGVDGGTPIINHPETALLGVGRITPKPWVYRDELAVRHVVQLSFTFDHRVCDGGTAAGFLRFVADCVEQPAVLLRHV